MTSKEDKKWEEAKQKWRRVRQAIFEDPGHVHHLSGGGGEGFCDCGAEYHANGSWTRRSVI